MLYIAYDLTIDSDLTLPEFPQLGAEKRLPDLLIRESDFQVPNVPQVHQTGPFTFSDDRTFWLTIPGMVKFRVAAGEEINYMAAPGVDPATVRLLLLGLPMAAVLAFRGALVLHGALFSAKDDHFALLGKRGPTRAKLVELSLKKKFSIRSDNFIAINSSQCLLTGNRRIEVPVSVVQQFSNNQEFFTKIRPGIERYSFISNASPLKSHKAQDLTFLECLPGRSISNNSVELIEGLSKHKLLLSALYAYGVLVKVYETHEAIQQIYSLGAAIRMVRVFSEWVEESDPWNIIQSTKVAQAENL